MFKRSVRSYDDLYNNQYITKYLQYVYIIPVLQNVPSFVLPCWVPLLCSLSPPPPRPWGAGLACYALSLLLFTLSSPVLFTPWLLPLALSASSCTSFHALPFHHSFMLTPDSFFMLFPFNLSAYFVSSSPLTCLLFIPLFPLYSPRPPPNPL